MTVDAFASWSHLVDHLLPIWAALPADQRGEFYATRSDGAAATVEASGVRCVVAPKPPTTGVPILVAGYADEVRAKGRPIALLEHGTGQSYDNANPALPGGTKRDRVGLFICPNESVAERNRVVYPDAAYAVVGSSPKMDAFYRGERGGGDPYRVCFTWHHDANGNPPEVRSAWPHYRQHFAEIVNRMRDDGFEVVGHAHPRAASTMRHAYRELGVRWVPTLAEVFDTCGILACDNSSAMFEFASLGRPVVVLNAPWYRREVEHGLRFWSEHRLGPVVDWPGDVPSAVRDARDGRYDITERDRIVDAVYPHRDGLAAKRAADAICAWLATGPVGVASRARSLTGK